MFKQKQILLRTVAVLSLVFFLASCSSEPSEEEEAKKQSSSSSEETKKNSAAGSVVNTVNLTESHDFETSGFYVVSTPDVDPTYGFRTYMSNSYETLLNTKQGEIVEGLAKKWEVSDSGLNITFHLKDGIKFSDGEKLTAKAVKKSIEASKKNLGSYLEAFGKVPSIIENIEIIDELTLNISLSVPYYGALTDFTKVMPMGIVSPASLNDDLTPKKDFMTATYGSGPYRYQGGFDGNQYTFVRNPNYAGKKPDADTFTVAVIPDNEAKIIAIQAGEIDMIQGESRLSAESALQMGLEDGYKTIYSDEIMRTTYLGFNAEKPPLNDKALREAISHAISKENIVENIYFNKVDVANTLLPKSYPFCNVEVDPPKYNKELAQKILQDNGYKDTDNDGIVEKDGKNVVLQFYYKESSSTLKDMVVTIQDDLNSVGIAVEPHVVDRMGWWGKTMPTEKGPAEFDLTLGVTYGPGSDSYLLINNLSRVAYSDPPLWQIASIKPEVENYISKLSKTSNKKEISEVYHYLLKSVNDEYSLLPIYYSKDYALINSNKIDSYGFYQENGSVKVANIKMK